MTLLLASTLGLIFGFVLQKTGAANPNRIVGMLLLRDFHLIKAILFAISISSFLLYLLIPLGFIEISHLNIKPSYIGVIIGGAILGVGWAIAGFCPGTGLVAAGAGRRDALFFIGGGLLGAFLYILLFDAIDGSFLFNSLGDKVTLVNIDQENNTAAGLPNEYRNLGIVFIVSSILLVIAWLLPVNDSTDELF